MDAAITQSHHQLKKNVPDINPGDRIRVHQKIKEGNKERVQVFEGLVIKTQHGRGINGTFTVRRISLGVGVEKNFPLHLPTIVKIEKLKSAKVRRAKLYYVRGLTGKRAKRLKREKENAAVWEDIVVEEPAKTEETAEDETEETTEETKENKEPKAEKADPVTGNEEKAEADEEQDGKADGKKEIEKKSEDK